MGAQVLDITGRFKPDFVIAHLFGRSPSVSIKEFKGKGYPLSKVVSFVWGSAEADIIAAGGMAVAEGYNTMQFAGVGTDFPVLKDIQAMYKAQGKQPPKEMESSVYYNRGVMTRPSMSRRCATPSRPRAAPCRPARTSRRAWRRSRASPWAACCRRWS
jgi:branched-chain amino acid transport system substrate-binding protein